MTRVFPTYQQTGVYKITNPDNEVYIGGTRNFGRRLSEYKKEKGQGRLIRESILKYGWSNHIFEVAHELPIDVSQELLDTYEQLYMDFYKDAGIKILNLKEAGQYGKPGEETKKRMSIARVGRPKSDETKKKMSVASMGIKKSDEHKKNIRASQIGRNPPRAKKVINTESGFIYGSVKCAANGVGINYKTLRRYLNGIYPNKTTLKYL